MEVITTMKNPGNQGFLVLSRRLLTQMFAEMYGKWHSDSQAYVYLLMAAVATLSIVPVVFMGKPERPTAS